MLATRRFSYQPLVFYRAVLTPLILRRSHQTHPPRVARTFGRKTRCNGFRPIRPIVRVRSTGGYYATIAGRMNFSPVQLALPNGTYTSLAERYLWQKAAIAAAKRLRNVATGVRRREPAELICPQAA